MKCKEAVLSFMLFIFYLVYLRVLIRLCRARKHSVGRIVQRLTNSNSNRDKKTDDTDYALHYSPPHFAIHLSQSAGLLLGSLFRSCRVPFCSIESPYQRYRYRYLRTPCSFPRPPKSKWCREQSQIRATRQ